MLNSFKAQQKSAFILGYTGELGKELTRAVVQSGVFKRVVLMGRRIVDYSNDSLLKDVVSRRVAALNKLEKAVTKMSSATVSVNG